jgi:hypothetical protein
MKKMVGYVVMLAGAALILARMFGSKFNIILPEILSGYILWAVAGALIVIGFFLTLGKTRKIFGAAEVPIYRGAQVVGYRRQ